MNILEGNINVLNYWYSNSSESLNGITREGNYLVYNGEKVDISKFSFYEIINGNNLITDQLSTLSPEDFFKIIKLHCQLVESQEMDVKQDKSHNKKMLERIKKIDPMMKNITIFERSRNGIQSQYFSVVDSTGIPHIFYNDRNVDIVALYSEVKISYGNTFTMENLIDALNRKLHDVKLNNSIDIVDSAETSEDFSNKMKGLNNQYKDNLSIRVLGNQEHDISFVSDSTDINNNKIITYDRNNNGDLVAHTHKQEIISDEQIQQEKTEDVLKADDKTEELELIPYDRFISLLGTNDSFTELENSQVNLWYSTLGDIMTYEDFLDVRIVSILRRFSEYIQQLAINADTTPLTIHQEEAMDKYEKMVANKDLVNKNDLDKKVENIKKLTLRPEAYYDRAGNVSAVQIVWVVVGIAIILTAVALYLIK